MSRERLELAERVRACEWKWADRRRLVREAAALLGETLPARLASDYAARTPQAEEGFAAIAAARAWAADPTEERRLAASVAYADAANASVAYADAANAANAAAAWAAAAAADHAGWAAAAADHAAWANAYAAAAAAASAEWAADAAADREVEHHWQRERLAIYLGSPSWPEPVEVTRG